MLRSTRSIPLQLLCQTIVNKNLLKKAMTVAPVSSFGSSIGAENEYEKYTVTSLKEKAEKYLTDLDTAQSSEKAHMAAKKALKDYVEKLQMIHRVEIVPPIIESPWTSGILERLVRLIMKKMDDKKKAEFIHGWASAFDLHARGWHENVFCVDDVRIRIPYVFRMIEIVENELPTTADMAIYLKENLFFVKLDVVAKQLAEAFIKENDKAIQHQDLIFLIDDTIGFKFPFPIRPEQVKEIVNSVQKELDQLNCKTDVKKAIVEMINYRVLKMI